MKDILITPENKKEYIAPRLFVITSGAGNQENVMLACKVGGNVGSVSVNCRSSATTCKTQASS